MLRTLLFFIVIYILVKMLSRLFLPSANRRQQGGPSSKAQYFYRVFNQMRQNARQQNNTQKQSNTANKGNYKQRFDEIEEAEYEEIVDEEEENESTNK